MPSTYEPIQAFTLSGTTTQISLTILPATYTDLIVVATGTSSSLAALTVQVNTDTASNYSFTLMQGDGTSATSTRGTTSANMGLIDSTISTSIIQFQNYSNTTTFKTFLGRGNDSAYAVRASVGLWRSTAAINSIQLGGSTFQNGFTVNVYGIKAA